MIASKKSSRNRRTYSRNRKPTRSRHNKEEGMLRITLIQSALTVAIIGVSVVLNGLGFMSKDTCASIQEVINRNYTPSEMVSSAVEGIASIGDGYGGELLTKVINLYRVPVNVPSSKIPNLPPVEQPSLNSRGYIEGDEMLNDVVLPEDGVPENTEEAKGEESLSPEGTASFVGVSPKAASLIGANTSIPDISLTLPEDIVEGGVITCGFGFREHPISGNQDFHTGVDIGAPLGTPIKVPFDGTVVNVGVSSAYGNYLEIQHGEGISSYYCHCEKVLVKKGQKVKKGKTIALVGSTGVSTGPHVHFELMLEGSYIDPTKPLTQRKEL